MIDINKVAGNLASVIISLVCYLPVLGPVFLLGEKEKVLKAIINFSLKNEFLAYDKNKRWYSIPQERIFVDRIVDDNDFVLIPVENQGVLKILYYSNNALTDLMLERIVDLTKNYQDGYQKIKLFCFKLPEVSQDWTCHNIYIAKIRKCTDKKLTLIYNFHDLPSDIKYTFQLMGRENDLGGFGFLWDEYLSSEKRLGNILCAVDNSEIIGAIGPLDVWKDAEGKRQLLPPYFGVREKWRGKGVSAALWQSAMQDAYERGATYTLVQNKPGSRAAEFYEEQGLENAGQVWSLVI